MNENNLNASGGVSIEGGFKDVGKGIGGLVGGAARGVGTVAGS